jgi:hypothetical protein
VVAAPPGLRGWRFRGVETALHPVGERFGGAYVAKFPNDETSIDRYREALAEDAEEIEPGDVKTFAALAIDSLERIGGGTLGRPMLAVVKADVDRLGAVFSRGLGDRRSLARIAALSRLVDAFFTGFLPGLMEQKFRDLYTVYAGGDDLLVIGPWLQSMQFALELRQRFDEFSGHNPNLTLSAGIAFFDPKTPVSRAAEEAEARLEKAKADGRDRVHTVLPVEDQPSGGAPSPPHSPTPTFCPTLFERAAQARRCFIACWRSMIAGGTPMLATSRAPTGGPSWATRSGAACPKETERPCATGCWRSLTWTEISVRARGCHERMHVCL